MAAIVLPMHDVVTRRALGRATLARQLLLERSPLAVPEALEHLVGLQGQAPDAPYVGLWSRLAGFAPPALADLVADGRVVRTALMRATVHLVTAADQARLRPLVQPVLDRAWAGSPFVRRLGGAGPAEIVALAGHLLAGGPLTRAQLSRALAPHWPDADPASLAYAATFLRPMVQAPPRGVWGRRAGAAWTDPPLPEAPASADCPEGAAGPAGGPVSPAALDGLLLRYLGAFGPASVKDAQVWSGLTRLREVADRLLAAGRLRPFRDEDGRVLLDLPDAPRPDADTPAPPRFLPEYDNLLLSHADRRRVNPAGRRVPLPPGNGAAMGTYLVDGVWSGTWRLVRGEATTLALEPFGDAPAVSGDVLDEAAALAAWLGASHVVSPGLVGEVPGDLRPGGRGRIGGHRSG
jgi:hypothetical protein